MNAEIKTYRLDKNTETKIELSIVIPTLNEEGNIGRLIKKVTQLLNGINYELLVVDGSSTDNTQQEAQMAGATVIIQKERGFGSALREGFEKAKGSFILTMDADFSHEPERILTMWKNRHDADIIVGSRYVKGGEFIISKWRKLLSIFTNIIFSRFLAIPVKDMSGNFRLYKKTVLSSINISQIHYNVLQEILVKAYAQGFTIKEVPIHYIMRDQGKSKLKITKFATAYFHTLKTLWNLRHSPASADYDERAHNSLIPLQRYWQRKRCNLISPAMQGNVLDIGCGSSNIIQHNPQAVAFDYAFHKLRYLKKSNQKITQGTISTLPFQSEVFDCVVCSEVIEHVPLTQSIFSEMKRVLKPEGLLIIGTPDYAKLTWRIIERIYDFVLPHAYAEEHQTKYTKDSLFEILKTHSFDIRDYKYICNSELIVFARNKQEDY